MENIINEYYFNIGIIVGILYLIVGVLNIKYRFSNVKLLTGLINFNSNSSNFDKSLMIFVMFVISIYIAFLWVFFLVFLIIFFLNNLHLKYI